MKKRLLTWALTFGVALSWLWLWGCGDSREPFAGNYRSLKPYADKGFIELVLKEKGEGTWKLEKEGTAHRFKWKVAQGRLWFYLREGAIVIVVPSQDGKTLTADLTGDWQDPSCPVSDNTKCVIFERRATGGS